MADGKPVRKAEATKTLAAWIGFAVGAYVAFGAWPRLWRWHFGGLVTDGPGSVWNTEAVYALVLVLRTGAETFLVAAVAILAAYGLVLGMVRAGRAIGREFMVGWRRNSQQR